MNNKIYPDNVICAKKNIGKQWSFCRLFEIFKNSKDFYITYKKIFHCNICNTKMITNEEMSGPLFSIDDEDSQFNSIEEIYNYRYTSYSSGCPICIKNNVDSNAYVLINDIKLP